MLLLLNKQGHIFQIKHALHAFLFGNQNDLYIVTHGVYDIQDTGFLKSQ